MKNILKILLFAVSLIFVFTLTSKNTSAVESTPSAGSTQEDTAQKLGITFPIADLGNCTSIASCRAYCETPQNQPACLEFAKKKGFDKPKAAQNETLEAAKKALGCDSIEACRQFCQAPENKDKCKKFAEVHKLLKQHANPASSEIIEKAKTALGCTSIETCKAICQQKENKKKCSEFARTAKPQFSPPPTFKNRGCPNQTACYEECKKDPSKCTTFSPRPTTSGSNKLFGIFPKPSPKPEAEHEIENETENSVKGAKTGPMDFVNSIISFFSIF